MVSAALSAHLIALTISCCVLQADRAKKLWDEMVNQGFKPELETYNHMISIASFVMESSQKQWEFVEVSRR